jgi:membrane dipeptidase
MNCLEQHRAAVGLSVITLLAASLWAVYRIQSESELPLDIPARIASILKDTPLIDGHNDLPYLLRIELQNKINSDRFTFRQGANSKEMLKHHTLVIY